MDITLGSSNKEEKVETSKSEKKDLRELCSLISKVR